MGTRAIEQYRPCSVFRQGHSTRHAEQTIDFVVCACRIGEIHTCRCYIRRSNFHICRSWCTGESYYIPVQIIRNTIIRGQFPILGISRLP